MKISKLLFILILLVSIGGTAFGQVTDRDEIVISQANYELEFYLNKDDKVNAELRVVKKFYHIDDQYFTVSDNLFFDNQSEIKKIRKSKRKVQSIISDYQSNGIFHSDLKRCYFEAEGYGTLKISYTKVFNDVMYIDPFYFHDNYDIEKSTLKVYVPDWLDVDIIEWNFDGHKIIKAETKEDDETIFTYKLNNITVLDYERGVPSPQKIYPHMLFNVKSAKIDGKDEAYLRDVGDLYQWYHSLTEEIGNENSNLKSTVNELVEGKTSDIDKIKSIFYWVQDNIRYVAFEYGIMGFRPESCQSVMSNKFGDCKGMANITKEMLTMAGYDARLTWIGTNSLPYDYSIPSLSVDNHMICTVFLDGEPIFLDATEKFADLYHYASRIQGKQVLIEDGENFIIDSIPVNKEANLELYNLELSIDGSSLVGKGEMQLSGGRKVAIANYLKSLPKNKKEDFLSNYIDNQDKNIVVNIFENEEERDLPLRTSYDLKIDNHIVDVGSELYVNTETDYTLKNFENIEDRTIPFDIGRELVFISNTKINVPTGFTVDYLPENISINNPYFSYDLGYTKEGNVIYYNKKIEIKEMLLPVDQFDNWNSSLNRLRDFYSDQIILKKT